MEAVCYILPLHGQKISVTALEEKYTLRGEAAAQRKGKAASHNMISRRTTTTNTFIIGVPADIRLLAND
ncbi:hypothetical protein Osc7112_2082 [Oscillatoria nigro-viridis PCC 7112]|uniref:Uncharacterized protein n=1 Tax=Phormidium nigroviride PCC 7112 TaxID=179408 RepID=K9VF45_9CYAN|nr:hypothetical protein [Oscillatoria nigro-viridis]AFZ06551.1 hypothetical protein Osc7112_2082 [Oscillatoria nigro-viridis PCC 7112]